MLYLFLSEAVRAVWRDVRLSSQGGYTTEGARLEVLDPARARLSAGSVYSIHGTTRIGRELGNDIVADDDTVSAEHARLVQRDGHWWIEDMGSTNGTWVNDRHVEGSRPLKPGDLIHVGRVRLRFGT